MHLCGRRCSVRTKMWPSPVWTPPQIRAEKYFPLFIYHHPWKDHQLLFCLSLTIPCPFCDVNLVDMKRAVCILTFPLNCFNHIFANSHRYSMEPAYITYCICPLISLILKVGGAACSSGMLVFTCKVTQHTWKTMWTHTAGKIPDFISCVMRINTPLAFLPPESNLVHHMDKCFSYLYCCTMHFEDSLSITHQWMHKLYISLKFIALKHLKCSYMFRSLDHPQGARIVPC